MTEKFIPSPAKLVKFLDRRGKTIRELHLNRRERRRLGIRKTKEVKWI